MSRHRERSLWPDLVREGFLGGEGEPPCLADVAYDLQVARPELLAGLLVGGRYVTGRVHSDRERCCYEPGEQGPAKVGVGAAYRDWAEFRGAAFQLGVNLLAILLSGAITLALQRAFYVRRRRTAQAPR